MEKIAYLTTSFGSLSHTFIRREIAELRKLGLDISLFSVYPEVAVELSDEDKLLAREADCLFPLETKIFPIIYSNIKFVITSPAAYFDTLQRILFNKEKNIISYLRLVCIFFVSSYTALALQKKNIVHVHAHFPFVSGAITMCAAGILGISYSITIHSPGAAISAKGLKQQIAHAQFLCFPSQYTIDYYDRIIPCRKKAYLIHCGIDPDKYVHSVKQSFTKKRNKEEVHLISIGRFIEKKGFIYLIEACNFLAEEGIRFKLIMIGDGPLRKKLQKKAEKYNLEDSIIFKGACSEAVVKQELERSDICVVPCITDDTGKKEGIPVVIIEAVALGIPVIATRHSGIPEIVNHRNTGILVPEKDAAAIAEAIKLLLRDDELREKCIKNARIKVIKEFNIRNTAKLLKKIFEENIQ